MNEVEISPFEPTLDLTKPRKRSYSRQRSKKYMNKLLVQSSKNGRIDDFGEANRENLPINWSSDDSYHDASLNQALKQHSEQFQPKSRSMDLTKISDLNPRGRLKKELSVIDEDPGSLSESIGGAGKENQPKNLNLTNKVFNSRLRIFEKRSRVKNLPAVIGSPESANPVQKMSKNQNQENFKIRKSLTLKDDNEDRRGSWGFSFPRISLKQSSIFTLGSKNSNSKNGKNPDKIDQNRSELPQIPPKNQLKQPNSSQNAQKIVSTQKNDFEEKSFLTNFEHFFELTEGIEIQKNGTSFKKLIFGSSSQILLSSKTNIFQYDLRANKAKKAVAKLWERQIMELGSGRFCLHGNFDDILGTWNISHLDDSEDSEGILMLVRRHGHVHLVHFDAERGPNSQIHVIYEFEYNSFEFQRYPNSVEKSHQMRLARHQPDGSVIELRFRLVFLLDSGKISIFVFRANDPFEKFKNDEYRGERVESPKRFVYLRDLGLKKGEIVQKMIFVKNSILGVFDDQDDQGGNLWIFYASGGYSTLRIHLRNSQFRQKGLTVVEDMIGEISNPDPISINQTHPWKQIGARLTLVTSTKDRGSFFCYFSKKEKKYEFLAQFRITPKKRCLEYVAGIDIRVSLSKISQIYPKNQQKSKKRNFNSEGVEASRLDREAEPRYSATLGALFQPKTLPKMAELTHMAVMGDPQQKWITAPSNRLFDLQSHPPDQLLDGEVDANTWMEDNPTKLSKSPNLAESSEGGYFVLGLRSSPSDPMLFVYTISGGRDQSSMKLFCPPIPLSIGKKNISKKIEKFKNFRKINKFFNFFHFLTIFFWPDFVLFLCSRVNPNQHFLLTKT